MIRGDWYMLDRGVEYPVWYQAWRDAQSERSNARNVARAELANTATRPTMTEALLEVAEKRHQRILGKRPRYLKARAKSRDLMLRDLSKKVLASKFTRVPFHKLKPAKQKAMRKAGRNFCPVWVPKKEEATS